MIKEIIKKSKIDLIFFFAYFILDFTCEMNKKKFKKINLRKIDDDL
jgi:hypothetical protein